MMNTIKSPARFPKKNIYIESYKHLNSDDFSYYWPKFVELYLNR